MVHPKLGHWTLEETRRDETDPATVVPFMFYPMITAPVGSGFELEHIGHSPSYLGLPT
jgi:hypothetical protein